MQKNDSYIADLSGIIQWYKSNCDDDWEHTFGVTLQTLDNPGWILTIDLVDTELDGASMEAISEGCDIEHHPDESAWIHCFIRDNKFTAACDPDQLSRLFKEFEQFRIQERTN